MMRRWVLRLSSRRHRRLLLAGLATVGIAGGVAGTVALSRWQAAHAARGDTRIVLNQAAQQLLRSLQSRRGTLTLLRDSLQNAPKLSLSERQALAKSAVAHTRHLLGIGYAQSREPPLWWVAPSPATDTERARLQRVLAQRIQSVRQIWQAPSTFTTSIQPTRPLLLMLEPLRDTAGGTGAIIGVFDLSILLKDFFELILQQPYPVQLVDGSQVLYQSPQWELALDVGAPQTIEHGLRLDAIQWTLRMQPGSTHTAQTVSSFRLLLAGLSVMAGAVTIGLIWLMAMRTWVLQRAVIRRTAALRRTTERLRQLAVTDELTGLHNRRFFLERWQLEFERAKRYQRPLVCLMIDVNRFKQINDALGHHIGDLVLKRVAQELQASLRQSDLLARFGGDEFIVVLPETSSEQAMVVVDKFRSLRIEGPWMRRSAVGPVQLSVGVGELEPHLSSEEVIQRADSDLYASRKRQPASVGPGS